MPELDLRAQNQIRVSAVSDQEQRADEEAGRAVGGVSEGEEEHVKGGTRKPPKWPIRYWHQIMRGWLVAEGYDYCYRCKSWKPNTKHHTCCECNRRMANDYYHSSHGLEKSMAWRKANKERVAVASKRFRESPVNQERIRGYSRKHSRQRYLKLRSTPEGMDKLREQWRRADSKRRGQRTWGMRAIFNPLDCRTMKC